MVEKEVVGNGKIQTVLSSEKIVIGSCLRDDGLLVNDRK